MIIYDICVDESRHMHIFNVSYLPLSLPLCCTLILTYLTKKPLPSLNETNIASENPWLEDECPFGMAYFQRLR